MPPSSRRPVTPHGAAERTEPNLSPAAARSAPRLVPVEPPLPSPRAAVTPRLELAAGDRPSLFSVDPAPSAMLGRSIAVKAALAVLVVFALIGAGSLAQRFLGL
ncbi:MAG TPA: hypothetical protein VMU87_13655 [Stellaceae bacterium]|nr:hypothetical protein [Stellaceae bacterium]